MNQGKQRGLIEEQLGPVVLGQHGDKWRAHIEGVVISDPTSENDEPRVPVVETEDKSDAFDHLWYLVTRLDPDHVILKTGSKECLRFDFDKERFVVIPSKQKEDCSN